MHALHDARIAERVEQIVLTLDNASPAVREVILQTSQHFGLEARLAIARNIAEIIVPHSAWVTILQAA